MDDAQELEDLGQPDGSVAWAGTQTAGRGRHGRTWTDGGGSSLLFTAFWHPARFRVLSFAPSLTVSLGLCLWLESLALPQEFPVALKWPNDVYLADRKLAGILVRRRMSGAGDGSIHAGVGVNLRSPFGAPEFRTPPVSLAEAGITPTPEAALKNLLPYLAQALDHPDPRGACEERLWKRGRTVELSVAGLPPAPGTVLGINDEGCLLWETAAGVQTVAFGE
jgi:BirA family biotin operon repressor/biotin-[acetyl-CoA-carboxylase] ligase